jgi:Uma2 family endonuclease
MRARNGTVALANDESVRIPAWVTDNEAYLRWACSDQFPEHGRLAFFHGEVWVDMSPEEIFTHNQLKNEFASVLSMMLKRTRLGRFYPDRCLLTNRGAGLSTEPDGMFISFQSIRSGRVRRVRAKRGYRAWSGTPDMVLEVVSESSVIKDTVVLKSLYWKARIAEYWLVDGRGSRLDFTILQRGPRAYLPVRKQAGWVKSEVFGKSFKLTVGSDEVGDPEYNLDVR